MPVFWFLYWHVVWFGVFLGVVGGVFLAGFVLYICGWGSIVGFMGVLVHGVVLAVEWRFVFPHGVLILLLAIALLWFCSGGVSLVCTLEVLPGVWVVGAV